MFIAAQEGPLAERARKLEGVWRELECHHIFRPNYAGLIPFRTALRFAFPRYGSRPRGFFNAGPLATLLRRAAPL